MRELHALVDRLQALQDMRQQERNRLEALAQGVIGGSLEWKMLIVVGLYAWMLRRSAEMKPE